jgi:hypothetical protein
MLSQGSRMSVTLVYLSDVPGFEARPKLRVGALGPRAGGARSGKGDSSPSQHSLSDFAIDGQLCHFQKILDGGMKEYNKFILE